MGPRAEKFGKHCSRLMKHFKRATFLQVTEQVGSSHNASDFYSERLWFEF